MLTVRTRILDTILYSLRQLVDHKGIIRSTEETPVIPIDLELSGEYTGSDSICYTIYNSGDNEITYETDGELPVTVSVISGSVITIGNTGLSVTIGYTDNTIPDFRVEMWAGNSSETIYDIVPGHKSFAEINYPAIVAYPASESKKKMPNNRYTVTLRMTLELWLRELGDVTEDLLEVVGDIENVINSNPRMKTGIECLAIDTDIIRSEVFSTADGNINGAILYVEVEYRHAQDNTRIIA